MRSYTHAVGSWLWPSAWSSFLLVCYVLSIHAAYLPVSDKSSTLSGIVHELPPDTENLRGRKEAVSLPASTSTPKSGSPSATAGSEIPLWGQCGLVPDKPCAGGARCICKDQWWSQCRLPINGSWAPLNETWTCTESASSTTVPPSPSRPTNASRSPSKGATSLFAPPIASRSQSDSAADLTTSSSTPSVSQPSNHSLDTSSAVPSFKTIQNLNTTPKASPASESFAASLAASAYAKPFNVSSSARLPKSSFAGLAINSSTQSLHSSTRLADGSPKPSGSSIMPNLACPSKSASGDAVSDHVAMSACDTDMQTYIGNLSLTTNSSSTPIVPASAEIDPDKGRTYLKANASSDQQSHCLRFAAHQYQICWEVLNVTGYLQDWAAFNHVKCDEEDMGFADCFLYLEVGAGANCTSFTGRSQCPSPDSKTFMGHPNGAQAYYVAFNIWNIQNWFFTYYMAVGGANGLTSEHVNTIARTLNLPPPKKFSILELLAGLAFALGLLSPSGYAAVIPKLGTRVAGLGAQVPGEYLLRAVQNAPTLSRTLVASGNLGDSDVQVAQLSSSLARIVSQLETNIQNSLVLVMSNFSIFFDFVHDGFFSTQIENLNTITQNVTLSLNTYIVSQALQNDEVIINRALNTDINELQLNGSAYAYDTGCGHGYDEWGMCGSWWYDSVNRISYGLGSQKNIQNNYTDALQSLFNQGVTTPELLFMNSQFCADAAGSTQGNAPGTSLSTTTGIWNTECISNVKICTWDTVNLGIDYEYTDCSRESDFARLGCGIDTPIVQVNVPASYIGPYLTDVEYQGWACNT